MPHGREAVTVIQVCTYKTQRLSWLSLLNAALPNTSTLNFQGKCIAVWWERLKVNFKWWTSGVQNKVRSRIRVFLKACQQMLLLYSLLYRWHLNRWHHMTPWKMGNQLNACACLSVSKIFHGAVGQQSFHKSVNLDSEVGPRLPQLILMPFILRAREKVCPLLLCTFTI